MEKRICYFCNFNSVKDELHLNTCCIYHDKFRAFLFAEPTRMDKVKFIMPENGSNTDFCLPIGTF